MFFLESKIAKIVTMSTFVTPLSAEQTSKSRGDGCEVGAQLNFFRANNIPKNEGLFYVPQVQIEAKAH